ncbi:DNA-binding response regulator [Stenotrophomonas maltophilia]|uniref:DNA-binding response regulator n=1 Tax=Stenotrophomonas maltophilia TaxID=40324 RepID=A0AAX1I8D9_STEMA|nr:response regulator transcription factor [Stenotrophomonas maltophilia]MCF3498180.1 response regulator [Stenotrophomonas maltophilia]PSD21408.1 DNA-binding response regulator [Stenotrophomonas maltophilia]QGL80487.1 response regulator transcription factor [Stenotrophomonas maltophilia]QNG76143.1 DNA-binding response regulator [Stenotrophomonas maltophilia]UGB23612.1 response regulator transcription factor [Stenotrophomonas maltophilia]
MNSLAIRVALADDHPVIRLGVQSALDEAPAIQCVGTAADSTELMALLQREPCDVLVTDYAMPGGNHGDGLDMLAVLQRQFPLLRIVVMTGLDQPGLIHKLDSSGVAGIVSKSDDLSHVQAAVMAVYAQRRYHSPGVLEQLRRKEQRRVIKLSPRETEVVALFIGGLSINEIALKLDLKKQTVSTQKVNAMRKLGIERDAELYSFAADLGLEPGPGHD